MEGKERRRNEQATHKSPSSGELISIKVAHFRLQSWNRRPWAKELRPRNEYPAGWPEFRWPN